MKQVYCAGCFNIYDHCDCVFNVAETVFLIEDALMEDAPTGECIAYWHPTEPGFSGHPSKTLTPSQEPLGGTMLNDVNRTRYDYQPGDTEGDGKLATQWPSVLYPGNVGKFLSGRHNKFSAEVVVQYDDGSTHWLTFYFDKLPEGRDIVWAIHNATPSADFTSWIDRNNAEYGSDGPKFDQGLHGYDKTQDKIDPLVPGKPIETPNRPESVPVPDWVQETYPKWYTPMDIPSENIDTDDLPPIGPVWELVRQDYDGVGCLNHFEAGNYDQTLLMACSYVVNTHGLTAVPEQNTVLTSLTTSIVIPNSAYIKGANVGILLRKGSGNYTISGVRTAGTGSVTIGSNSYTGDFTQTYAYSSMSGDFNVKALQVFHNSDAMSNVVKYDITINGYWDANWKPVFTRARWSLETVSGTPVYGSDAQVSWGPGDTHVMAYTQNWNKESNFPKFMCVTGEPLITKPDASQVTCRSIVIGTSAYSMLFFPVEGEYRVEISKRAGSSCSIIGFIEYKYMP